MFVEPLANASATFEARINPRTDALPFALPLPLALPATKAYQEPFKPANEHHLKSRFRVVTPPRKSVARGIGARG